MANVEKIVETVVVAGKTLMGDENVKSFLCGTYADGTPRSLPDALNGEFISPKQKKKATEKKKKKKKKKNVKFKL